MATLQKIRNRGGILVSIVIGLALFAFIVGDALSSGSRIFSYKRNQVGEIAGKSISIMEYQNELHSNEDLVKLMNNTSNLNEEQSSMLRENTWQQIVMEAIMNPEYEELGIEVTGDELYDMLLGDNMSPAIRQLFADPNTGDVDMDQARNTIKTLIDSPSDSPQKAYWLNMEEEIATSRKLTKYTTLVSKALFITDTEATEYAQNNATQSDISYIVKNYSSISDSSIQVTNKEINSYYNANPKRFQQTESRKIVYVNFTIEPSSNDFAETEKQIKDIMTEFAETSEPGEFVNLSSDTKFDPTYYKASEIGNDSLARFLMNNPKAVYGPYLEKNSYKLSRLAHERMLPDSVRARHILLTPQRDQGDLKKIADSLAGLLKKGADFEQLVKTYSADQTSAVNGGDLGWFSQKTMIQPFSDTVFFAQKGDIKVVATQYGYHVVQVTDMAKPVQKVQIATFDKEVIPSAETSNSIYNNARMLVTGVETLGDFDKKVNELNLVKRIATVNKNEKTIGSIEDARELVRQTYRTEKSGMLIHTFEGSTIFETGNAYVVAVLTEVNEEGTAPINSVAADIKKILVQKKKAEMLKKELDAARSGSESLLSIAQKAGLEVKDATDITFNSFQMPGAGIEPKVIATVAMTEQGKISSAIEGNQGVFVIMVTNRKQDAVTPDMVKATHQELGQFNAYKAQYQTVQTLVKNAQVKDYRYKFY